MGDAVTHLAHSFLCGAKGLYCRCPILSCEGSVHRVIVMTVVSRTWDIFVAEYVVRAFTKERCCVESLWTMSRTVHVTNNIVWAGSDHSVVPRLLTKSILGRVEELQLLLSRQWLEWGIPLMYWILTWPAVSLDSRFLLQVLFFLLSLIVLRLAYS